MIRKKKERGYSAGQRGFVSFDSGHRQKGIWIGRSNCEERVIKKKVNSKRNKEIFSRLLWEEGRKAGITISSRSGKYIEEKMGISK